MQTFSDTQLRELAKKRVDFWRHLIVYFVIITMLWVIWYVTDGSYPWPIWPMGGWGVGLIFHYLFDYRSSNLFSEEEEFKRLKKIVDEKSHG